MRNFLWPGIFDWSQLDEIQRRIASVTWYFEAVAIDANARTYIISDNDRTGNTGVNRK